MSVVTPKALVLVLATCKVLKLLLSSKAVKLVWKDCMMYITPDKPEIVESFFWIFALMSFFWGISSAFTKFCASALTLTPEPAPKAEIIDWPAA